jgi:hypothetical protein
MDHLMADGRFADKIKTTCLAGNQLVGSRKDYYIMWTVMK